MYGPRILYLRVFPREDQEMLTATNLYKFAMSCFGNTDETSHYIHKSHMQTDTNFSPQKKHTTNSTPLQLTHLKDKFTLPIFVS